MTRLLRRLANRSRDLLFTPAMDAYWRRQSAGTLRCLLYHRVGQPGEFPFLDAVGAPMIEPRALADELEFLRRHGAKFFTFADLRAGTFPAVDDFGVIVSFDDGFRDAYTTGLPVLESVGARGVVFQATALIDSNRLIWEHDLYWHWHQPTRRSALIRVAHARFPATRQLADGRMLEYLRETIALPHLQEVLDELGDRQSREAQAEIARRLYPAASDLVRAQAAGHELGSHGHHHYKRSSIDSALFERELGDSAKRLESVTGAVPRAFSYPFNSYQAGDRELCGRYFAQVATVDAAPIARGGDSLSLPRYTWPGPPRNGLRRRRWLWTGRI